MQKFFDMISEEPFAYVEIPNNKLSYNISSVSKKATSIALGSKKA